MSPRSESSRHGSAPSRTADGGARPAVRQLVAGPGDADQRIDNFLIRVLKDVPRSAVYRLLRTGQVRVNGRRVKPGYRLSEGDRIRIPPVATKPGALGAAPSRSLRDLIAAAVIHEDRDLIVIDKPAGVAVHGGSGLSHGVIEALRAMHPQLGELELVHRLDRDTSGCLLVAKRRVALRALHRLLREREMEKRYLALVVGRWPYGRNTIDLPLETNLKHGGERVVRVHPAGQSAVTTFVPLETYGRLATLLDVKIGTGRTHQIRVHAAHAGHPVAGDPKYGDRTRDAQLKEFGLDRMFLHAHSLTFAHPSTEGPLTVTAPLPPALQAVLDRLSASTSDRREERVKAAKSPHAAGRPRAK